MVDIGLTHIALPVSNIEQSIEFYKTYAQMDVVHHRVDRETKDTIVWLSDHTRPFAIVLYQTDWVNPVLAPFAHLGVGCESREAVDKLCNQARKAGVTVEGPQDSGPPVGYWAFLADPDGHKLELSHGQEIGLTTEKRNV